MRGRRHVADHEQRGVVGAEVRAIERLQVGDRQRLDGRRQAVRGGPVTMRRAIDDARERELDQRARVVARLQQIRQPLLAQAIELRRGEGGAQRHVRHQRQRIAELRDRHREPHRRIIKRARRREIRAEELERVGEVERRSRAGAFVEHGGGEAADAELADRIRGAARTHDQVDLRERHLVMLDDPHPEAVRQLLFLDGRQLERRRGPDGGRLGAVWLLRRRR